MSQSLRKIFNLKLKIFLSKTNWTSFVSSKTSFEKIFKKILSCAPGPVGDF